MAAEESPGKRPGCENREYQSFLWHCDLFLKIVEIPGLDGTVRA